MAMKRRVFVSSPRDEYLDGRRNQLKWAIVSAIERIEPGYEAQVFGSPEGGRGLAAAGSWSAENAANVMRRCVGAAILGFPIWAASSAREGKAVSLVTEYCHYEGALARAFRLPVLAVLEEGVEERVFFARHAGTPVITAPIGADHSWVTQDQFRAFLQRWKTLLGQRRDLFLAYSSKLQRTADHILTIVAQVGATVLDWRRDFVGGKTILEQVEEAAGLTSGGIFLFTRDDVIKGAHDKAAPRDNVIFEAGFFAHAKGHERVLIIREAGAKMPADIGGVVYETLSDRSDTSGLEERVRKFIEESI
jgi:hypothetical protein